METESRNFDPQQSYVTLKVYPAKTETNNWEPLCDDSAWKEDRVSSSFKESDLMSYVNMCNLENCIHDEIIFFATLERTDVKGHEAGWLSPMQGT